MNFKQKDETVLAFSGLCALLSGVLNGFIGTGGGVILLLLLKKLCPGEDGKDAFAAVILAVLPMSIISACVYNYADPGIFMSSLPFLMPAAAGGLLGAVLLDKIKAGFVNRIFGALLFISGILAVIR